MMIIRHVQQGDLDDIYALAVKSGVGMTSLPQNKEILAARITRMQETVAGQLARGEQGYLFVLEDTRINKVVGLSGIEVAVGLNEPFYNFHVGRQVHASQALRVYKALDTLFLSNDLTGSSELCSLFLDPDYRENQNGKFLSKVRFLFIAAFQSYFEQRLIAEMRGYSDENGRSAFWDALGHHFFSMDFATADYLSGVGQKIFIAELMPRFPVYVDLLPQAAQQAIAKVHPHTRPAFHVLEMEGLQYKNYVDIFDAGPTLEAEIKNLRAVKDSRVCKVDIVEQLQASSESYLVANDHYEQYRVILVQQKIGIDRVELSVAQAAALQLRPGHQVRILPMNTTE